MRAGSNDGKYGTNVLLTALSDPATAASFTVEEWDLLLRLARATRLLGRIAVCMEEQDLLAEVPHGVVDHFSAAKVFVNHRQRTARWEINRILAALAGSDMPLVLLKGGAYIFAELPPSRGRLLSDVDLLVPGDRLDSFEQTLLGHGWESVKLEEYDQRYYRTWMHELPPLSHPERGLEVDIHHTISPLTSRLSPDPARLIADSIPLADSRLRILQPVDMVLHSAVHLFHDGEFINGLRDLVDQADLFVIFLIAVQAELTQTPFDMPIAESELVAGYQVEYTGIRFLVYFISEFATAVAFAAVASTLFLGGWAVPESWGISRDAMHWVGPLVLATKAVLLVGVVFWVRFSFPRFREDQLQKLAWKVLIPLALVNIAITGVLKVAF